MRWIAVILFVGCSAPPKQQCVNDPVEQPRAPTALAMMNQPFELVLRLQGPGCPVEDLAVFTAVTDPLNRPVAHTHAAPGRFHTVVSFTPTMPGLHHVSARFEPQIGVEQVEVMVAIDKTASASTTFDIDSRCYSLEVMPSGLVLCDEGQQLTAYRGGVALQSLPFDLYAVAGPVLWLTHGSLVERIVEAQGLLPFAAGATLNVLGPLDMVLPAVDEAMAVGEFAATKVAFDAGNLTETARRTDALKSAGLHFVSNGFAALVSVTTSAVGDQLTRRCVRALTDAGNIDCTELGNWQNAVLAGADGNGVWTMIGKRLRLDTFDSTGKASTYFSPTVGNFQREFRFPHEQSPIFISATGAYLSPRLAGDEIVFDAVKPEKGFVLKSATSRMLRLENPDGRQTVIPR